MWSNRTINKMFLSILLGLLLPPLHAFSQGIIAYPDRAKAPDFTLPNLKGGQVALKELQGKPVLIVFWQTT